MLSSCSPKMELLFALAFALAVSALPAQDKLKHMAIDSTPCHAESLKVCLTLGNLSIQH